MRPSSSVPVQPGKSVAVHEAAICGCQSTAFPPKLKAQSSRSLSSVRSKAKMGSGLSKNRMVPWIKAGWLLRARKKAFIWEKGELGSLYCVFAASCACRGSMGSHGWAVEKPHWGEEVSHGMGVRAPSRPKVSGQLAMASGSRRCSNGTCACGRPSS